MASEFNFDHPLIMDTPSEITLDKADPSVGEAFKDCQPGDTYTVVSADADNVVLDYAPAETETPAEDASGGTDEGASDAGGNPAMAAMMAKKKGMA